MKHFLFLFFSFLLIASCEPRLKPDKPDNLLDKEKMTNVLYDMFIVSNAKGVNRSTFEKIGLSPEQFILNKHNIDSLQFAKSNDYYAYDIEAYMLMIDDIKARLNSEKEKYEAIEKEEQEEKKRQKDSLKELRNASSVKEKLLESSTKLNKQD